MMGERRYVWVEDRSGTKMPFSKGILVSSVMVAGIPPKAAYALAETIEDALFSAGRTTVRVEELTETVVGTIERQLGPAPAAAWAAWVQARRAGDPIVLLLGGGTGSGKSMVATRLAGRLGISRVMATDAVREVMRGSFPETILPVLHLSSFEAHRGLRAPLPDDQDPVIAGFRQQVEVVASGIRRLVDRALQERTDVIVEGVHVVPGTFGAELARWRRDGTVVELVLSVPDPEKHRAHFLARLEQSHGRRPDRYLEHFEEIRRIQRYILVQARAEGTPQLVVEHLDEVVQEASALAVQSVTESARRESASA